MVEHPFGTLKRRAEMVLEYNFRRMLKELGVAVFMAYCQARREARGMVCDVFQGEVLFLVIAGQNGGLIRIFGDFVGDIW